MTAVATPLDAPPVAPRSADRRIERLSAVSAARVLEPDVAVPGHVGEGQVVPTELLSVAGLGLDLDADQLAVLAREELASILLVGVRFESALTVGFSYEILRRADLLDPRVTYILHEIGEETRHSRLFLRLAGQLAPTAGSPFVRGLPVVERIIRAIVKRPTLFCVAVLTGEEIPDLLQARLAEHPDTDPVVKALSRYHRQEEARHLSFARILLPELWEHAPRTERFLVRHVAPHMIQALFDSLVHPGVYEAAGLPGWATWRRVRRCSQRRAVLHQALRPLVAAMVDGGLLEPGRVPRAWRRVAGIDRHAQPLAAGDRGAAR